jgi:hypothetical protein
VCVCRSRTRRSTASVALSACSRRATFRSAA